MSKNRFLQYLQNLSRSQIILWCYLIWYLAMSAFYFDPNPMLWLSSLGIAVIIGFALILSTQKPGGANRDRWETFRLFLVPFCVSSYAALIKGKHFFLVFSAKVEENLLAAGGCVVWLILVGMAKRQRYLSGEA